MAAKHISSRYLRHGTKPSPLDREIGAAGRDEVQHDACDEEAVLHLEDQAFIAFSHERYDEAASYFDLLRQRIEEVDDSALYTHGLCLKKLGREDEALEVFEEVIQNGRRCLYDILAAFEKAHLLLLRGRMPEAVEALKTARTQDPEMFETYYRRQYLHLKSLVDGLT